jgi:hypothetical protein
MGEDPVTEEMRLRQGDRERSERREAESSGGAETKAHRARADKAAYLRRKLEERARAEREAARRR